jgi:hypothetical protein
MQCARRGGAAPVSYIYRTDGGLVYASRRSVNCRSCSQEVRNRPHRSVAAIVDASHVPAGKSAVRRGGALRWARVCRCSDSAADGVRARVRRNERLPDVRLERGQTKPHHSQKYAAAPTFV